MVLQYFGQKVLSIVFITFLGRYWVLYYKLYLQYQKNVLSKTLGVITRSTAWLPFGWLNWPHCLPPGGDVTEIQLKTPRYRVTLTQSRIITHSQPFRHAHASRCKANKTKTLPRISVLPVHTTTRPTPPWQLPPRRQGPSLSMSSMREGISRLPTHRRDLWVVWGGRTSALLVSCHSWGGKEENTCNSRIRPSLSALFSTSSTFFLAKGLLPQWVKWTPDWEAWRLIDHGSWWHSRMPTSAKVLLKKRVKIKADVGIIIYHTNALCYWRQQSDGCFGLS